jgi:hypothetical protein
MRYDVELRCGCRQNDALLQNELSGGAILRDLRVGEYAFTICAVTLGTNGSWTEVMHFSVAPTHDTRLLSIGAAGAVLVVLMFAGLLALFMWRQHKAARLTVVSTNPDYDPIEPDDWEVSACMDGQACAHDR